MMKMWLGLLVFVLAVQPATADESSSHRIYAKPVVRTAPTYPSSELRKRQQGWVELNYVVTAEGKVIEPVIEASSGSRAFERAAINTVKRWRYEPALVDGEPIQQCKTAVRISFALEGSETGVSRDFRRRYKKIDKALGHGDIEFAVAELERAFEADGLTLGELSWLWALKARIAGLQGDKDVQLMAVRRAQGVGKNRIPDELRAGLLKTQIVREIEKGEYTEAMATYSQLKDIDGIDTSELDPLAEKIRAVAEGDQLFFQAAEIGANNACETCELQWRYKPLRRSIEIADINGTLEKIELRCDWQRYTDTARAGVVWQIPASWGECSVVVHGETGSTFKLVELPAT